MSDLPTPTRESDRVEEALRRLILTLQVEPGQAVSEAALMKHYGWGRTPLREAFQRLAEQGLLQIVPRQGVVITPLSVFEFVEVMDAMALVIGPATVMAARRLNGAQLDRLEQITGQAEAAAQAQDFAALADLDTRFHTLLAQARGNRYLCRYLIHLHQMAARFNLAAWQRDAHQSAVHQPAPEEMPSSEGLPSLQEHRRIVTLLRQRDYAALKSAMLEHVENARQRVVGGLQVEA